MGNLKEVPEEAKQESKTPEESVEQSTKYGDYNVEIIRDYYGNVDVTHLPDKDPEFAYRFLRDDASRDGKGSGKNLAIKTSNLLFQKGGWQLCPKEHCLRIKIKERELSPDGFFRRGDLVLAFMPKKLFEEKEKYKEERAKEPMKIIKRLQEKGTTSIDGKDAKSIHETMKGIQTAKDLGMK